MGVFDHAALVAEGLSSHAWRNLPRVTKKMPAKKRTVPKQPAELNQYASYTPGPWGTSDSKVLEAIANREWSASTKEFMEMAKNGTGKVEGVANLWNMLCAIVRNHATRVNVFTHANQKWIALSGTVIPGNVDFPTKSHEAYLDTINLTNASQPEFTFSDKHSKNITFEQVRHTLGDHGLLVLYACHTAVDPLFLKEIAVALHVTVKGFKEEIRHYPVVKHGKITGWKLSVGKTEPVSDFHDLDQYAVTATP